MPTPRDPALFRELSQLVTEDELEASRDIDTVDAEKILHIINQQDQRVAAAVAKCIPAIAAVVERVAQSFRTGGRLLYLGAGTSGRLGVLDAAECPPTFGTDPAEVVGIIAGGRESMFRAQEGAEDDPQGGRAAVDEAQVTERDCVVGIAASRRTPYVRGGLVRARELGAFTALVTCNPALREAGSGADQEADVVIAPVVGPEVITGSTRMKAGTAQKLVLNMITTAAMVRRGKTYGNLMVDLRTGSAKLVERSRRIVMRVTGLDYDAAAELLERADGHVKVALVMHLRGVDAADARARLDAGGGFVRAALEPDA